MVPKKITEPFSVKNNLKKDFLFLYCGGVCEFVSSNIFICYYFVPSVLFFSSWFLSHTSAESI